MSANWSVQSDDGDTIVKVKTGGKPTIDCDSGRTSTSEFIIQTRSTGEHVHIGIDENGDTVFESRDQR